MKIILVTLFSLISIAYSYESDNISISDYEFRRYIRPQLKSISNEFQTLLFSLNPELKDFKSVYSDFRSLNILNQEIRSECKSSTSTCDKEIKSVEAKLLEILKNISSANLPQTKNIDNKMSWRHSKELIQQQALKLSQSAQNLLFQKEITGSLPSSLLEFSEMLSEFYDSFNVFIIKASDERFRNEINNFWANFIKPIENYALFASNRVYFKSRVTELNMIWHMLNVRLTKRGYTPTKQVSTLLNIMQRRWNNILKVSLKPRA